MGCTLMMLLLNDCVLIHESNMMPLKGGLRSNGNLISQCDMVLHHASNVPDKQSEHFRCLLQHELQSLRQIQLRYLHICSCKQLVP